MENNQIEPKDKIGTIFKFSLLSIIILIFSTKLWVNVFNSKLSIILAVILMISAMPVHILGKKSDKFYILSFTINLIASGLSISAYYTEYSVSISFSSMLLSIIPSVIVLSITYLMLKKNIKKKISIIISSILIFIFLSIAIYLWLLTGYALYSLAFFTLLLSIIYIVIFGVNVDYERVVLKDISFGSFGTFIFFTTIVFLILTDGDILSGADIPLTGDEKKKIK